VNYIEQEIVVQGAEDENPGVGIGLGSKLFRQIERTVQPCVRMALTGRSAQVGQPPKWLQAAWDVRAMGFSRRGSDTVIHLSVPKLGDAAPKAFEQQTLWDDAVKPDETAIDVAGARMIEAYRKVEEANAAIQSGHQNMGKNDVWIAATAIVTGLPLLTADKDFNHLDGNLLEVCYFDPQSR
jgi:predicted nucleic acid-binding protein